MGKIHSSAKQDIGVGMEVEINPRSDRTRTQLVRGIVAEVHTKNRDHPHGVLVTLEDGRVGRVKHIVGPTRATQPPKPKETEIRGDESTSLAELIAAGENQWVEFKSNCLWSSDFSNEEIKIYKPPSKELHAYGKAASKVIVAKSIAGFLNSNGGALIIGVREDKETGEDEIVGIEGEFEKLRDRTRDGYRRMIVEIVKSYFPSSVFNQLGRYIKIDIEEVAGAMVCGIRVRQSDKRVFLKLNNEDHFFVRIDASTRELLGEEIVEYCESRFG